MAATLQTQLKPLSSVLLAKSVFERTASCDSRNGPPSRQNRIGGGGTFVTSAVAAGSSAKDSFVQAAKEKYESKSAKRSSAGRSPLLGPLHRAVSLDSPAMHAATTGASGSGGHPTFCASTGGGQLAVVIPSHDADSTAATTATLDAGAEDDNSGEPTATAARQQRLPRVRTLPARRLRADDSGIDDAPTSPCDENGSCDDTTRSASSSDVERFRSIIDHLLACTAAATHDSVGGGGGSGCGEALRDVAGAPKLVQGPPSSPTACHSGIGGGGTEASDCGAADGPYRRLLASLSCCRSHAPLLQLVARTLVDTLMALASYRRRCAALEQAYRHTSDELHGLQLEMAEMKDKFSEDGDGGGCGAGGADSALAELQRELGAASRANRTLQFKLKSAERRASELDSARARLEDELRRLRPGAAARSAPPTAVCVAEAMERELVALRELVETSRQEASSAVEMRPFYEQEIDKLKRERSELQLENERLRAAAAATAAAATLSSDGGHGLPPQQAGSGVEQTLESSAAAEASRLRSDLETSIERERDAKEQLQFAQDEVSSLRRKLKEIEGDNESLARELQRLSGGGGGKRPQQLTNGDAPAHHGLSNGVAKDVNDRKGSPAASKSATTARATAGGGSCVGALSLDVGSVYREAKYEAMSKELDELRWQLDERDRIIAQTRDRASERAATGSAAEAGQPRLRRAVSLDSSALAAVDSNRQIDLMHQEAQVLRDKLQALEGDHERAVRENKKLLMLLSRKASGGSVDRARAQAADAREELAALRAENTAVRQKLELVLSGTQSGRLIDELESENASLRTELAFYQRSRRQAKDDDD